MTLEKKFNLNCKKICLWSSETMGFCLPPYQSSPQHMATSHMLPYRLFHQEAKMLLLMMSVLLLMVLLAWIHFFSDASLSESLISPSGA